MKIHSFLHKNIVVGDLYWTFFQNMSLHFCLNQDVVWSRSKTSILPQVSPLSDLLRRDGPGLVLGEAVQHLIRELGKIHFVLQKDALTLWLDFSSLTQSLHKMTRGGKGKRLVPVDSCKKAKKGNTHPSAKLLLASQLVIRHMYKVLA